MLVREYLGLCISTITNQINEQKSNTKEQNEGGHTPIEGKAEGHRKILRWSEKTKTMEEFLDVEKQT